MPVASETATSDLPASDIAAATLVAVRRLISIRVPYLSVWTCQDPRRIIYVLLRIAPVSDWRYFGHVTNHDTGLNAAVAAELRAEKAARGLTNVDISAKSGFPEVSVQRYLAAKRAIDVHVLDVLARALGADAPTILERASRRYDHEERAAAHSGDVEPGGLE